MRTKPAVVLTTYNQPRLLELCLESFCNQTVSNYDLYVADDGSTEDTKKVIDRYRFRLNRDITHVWHPDLGYRKSIINNRVFSTVDENKNSIIICIDHDVILHHRFVEDHIAAHERYLGKEVLFMGRRIDIGPMLSKSLKISGICEFNLGLSLSLLKSWVSGETKNISRSIRISVPSVVKFLRRDRVFDLLGSNYSINTKLLKQINGYNEDYQSYWGEDGDLFVRARNAGAHCYGWKGFGIQYHLDHPRLDPTAEHQARYLELLKSYDYVRCDSGIFKSS